MSLYLFVFLISVLYQSILAFPQLSASGQSLVGRGRDFFVGTKLPSPYTGRTSVNRLFPKKFQTPKASIYLPEDDPQDYYESFARTGRKELLHLDDEGKKRAYSWLFRHAEDKLMRNEFSPTEAYSAASKLIDSMEAYRSSIRSPFEIALCARYLHLAYEIDKSSAIRIRDEINSNFLFWIIEGKADALEYFIDEVANTMPSEFLELTLQSLTLTINDLVKLGYKRIATTALDLLSISPLELQPISSSRTGHWSIYLYNGVSRVRRLYSSDVVITEKGKPLSVVRLELPGEDFPEWRIEDDFDL